MYTLSLLDSVVGQFTTWLPLMVMVRGNPRTSVVVRECERQTEPRASANFHYFNFEYITGCSRQPKSRQRVARPEVGFTSRILK